MRCGSVMTREVAAGWRTSSAAGSRHIERKGMVKRVGRSGGRARGGMTCECLVYLMSGGVWNALVVSIDCFGAVRRRLGGEVRSSLGGGLWEVSCSPLARAVSRGRRILLVLCIDLLPCQHTSMFFCQPCDQSVVVFHRLTVGALCDHQYHHHVSPFEQHASSDGMPNRRHGDRTSPPPNLHFYRPPKSNPD